MEAGSDPISTAENSEAPARAALQEAIGRRARELYELRGRVAGHELEDWLQAEAELTRAKVAPVLRRVVVKVGGITCTGEYDPASCDGYKPGDLQKGAPVAIRFEKDKMHIKLPSGEVLEAKIVKVAKR